MASYPRIPEEQYRKARGQLQLSVGEVLYPLRKYGQDVYVQGALEEILELAEAFAMRVRGKDVPIMVKNKRNPRT